MPEIDKVRKLDLADAKAYLEFSNAHTQALGFSALAEKLLHGKLTGSTLDNYRNVLFDCWFEYGDVPFELLLDTLPVLIKKSVFTSEVIVNEYSARITKIDRVQRAFYSLVDTCKPPISKFLTLAAQIDQRALMEVLVDEYFYANHLRYIFALLFTKILADDHKRKLGEDPKLEMLFRKYFPKHYYPHKMKRFWDQEEFLRVCSPEELQRHPLDGLNLFQKHKLMRERPRLLRNLRLVSHTLYMPYFFVMCYHRKAYFETADPQNANSEEEGPHIQVAACQDQRDLLPVDFENSPLNMETFLSHVVHNSKIEAFIRFAEHHPDALRMLEKPYALPSLIVLLPHTSNEKLQRRICDLTVSLIEKTPEEAEGFIMYFISVFSNPFFHMPKEITLETILKLAVNKHVVHMVANFFVAIINAKDDFRVVALDCLTKLIQKHKQVEVYATREFLKIDVDEESKFFMAKLKFAKQVCIETDDHDHVLEIFTKLLRGSGQRLASTIEIVKDLVKNDVLDLSDVQKILQIKKQTNELVIGAYCGLLSVVAAPDTDKTEEENETWRMECIKELLEYTKHPAPEVISKAWKALGFYDVADIEKANPDLTPSYYGTIFAKLPEVALPGFVDFAQKAIAKEVESYPRPLYKAEVQETEVPPLLARIDKYKDQFMTKIKDDAWFWKATLPLVSPILQLHGPTNKAMNACRLLKSCLLNVPESTSHEDMLRLMASWRICVREALDAICDSKNDILYARDQIAREGQISLTQKAESVDNVMMMLTMLVDAVEEKLRVCENPNQVVEVTKAQKPWIISVFEFVATRLPANVKERRTAKANPIYQLETQSNKSSLFIAIFCTRLLYRNPTIIEYYGDICELQLKRDSMFGLLFEGLTAGKSLENEDIPDRKMFWIIAQAYGVDEMTAKAYAVQFKAQIDEKTVGVTAPILEKPEDVELFFKNLVAAPKESLGKIQQQTRKMLEKFWNNGTEDVKRNIYEGLAELMRVSGRSGKQSKTIPVEKLPESSVLKSLLLMFDDKHDLRADVLRKLFPAFENQKRSDGRYLPPIDWMKYFERVDWESFQPLSRSRLSVVTLACEQACPEVLFNIKELGPHEIVVVAEHLHTVARILPAKKFREVLDQLYSQAKSEKDPEHTQQIAEAIASNQKNPLVRHYLTTALPSLETVSEVINPVLTALKEPEEFGGGTISSCFDLWLEAKRGDKMNIEKICNIILDEKDIIKRNFFYPLLSHESRRLTKRGRFGKLLDVVTVSRIFRGAQRDVSFILPVFMSLIVSPTDGVDVPICWFDNEEHFYKMLTAARQPFIEALIADREMKNCVRHIAEFLRVYIYSNEKGNYEHWQSVMAAEFYIHLIVAFHKEANPNLYTETDSFWESIFPMRDFDPAPVASPSI